MCDAAACSNLFHIAVETPLIPAHECRQENVADKGETNKLEAFALAWRFPGSIRKGLVLLQQTLGTVCIDVL